MAFNKSRILNQSTIKENKQGHPDDSEDRFKKSISAGWYQIHFNLLFLTALIRMLFPNILLHSCVCIYT